MSLAKTFYGLEERLKTLIDLQHIVHSVQSRLSSKSDGLPQSAIKDEIGSKSDSAGTFFNVMCGTVPDILLL